MTFAKPNGAAKAATGIQGLDDLLKGGIPRQQFFFVQGRSGTGKTTLGLQFLLQGRDAGEKGLYLSFFQDAATLERIARSHGWDLAGLAYDLIGNLTRAARDTSAQTIFHSAHVELEEVVQAIGACVARVKPDRMVLDSISEIHLLADTPSQSQRTVVALRQLLMAQSCTVLFTGNPSSDAMETDLKVLFDGIVNLERHAPLYGASRRPAGRKVPGDPLR